MKQLVPYEIPVASNIYSMSILCCDCAWLHLAQAVRSCGTTTNITATSITATSITVIRYSTSTFSELAKSQWLQSVSVVFQLQKTAPGG